jgi:hypothetical protein
MEIAGPAALIIGLAGIAGYFVITAFTRWRPPRAFSITVMAVILAVTCVGLILVTIASGGRSLHTGG